MPAHHSQPIVTWRDNELIALRRARGGHHLAGSTSGLLTRAVLAAIERRPLPPRPTLQSTGEIDIDSVPQSVAVDVAAVSSVG